jgi:hypothetical protein
MSGYAGVSEASNIWEVWGLFVGDTVYFPKAGMPSNRVRPYEVVSTELFAVACSDTTHLWPYEVASGDAARLGMTKEPPGGPATATPVLGTDDEEARQ